jgi:hypothetical protein
MIFRNNLFSDFSNKLKLKKVLDYQKFDLTFSKNFFFYFSKFILEFLKFFYHKINLKNSLLLRNTKFLNLLKIYFKSKLNFKKSGNF